MKISTRGRYALRMLLDITDHQEDGYVTLKDISTRQDISRKYLEQIALRLSQAGMLKAVRGHQGGYMLSRPAEAYTAFEILQVVEGDLAPVACLKQAPNACERCHECLTLPLWQGLEKRIADYLKSVTLQDLVDGRLPEA